jgi:hypothetical protein
MAGRTPACEPCRDVVEEFVTFFRASHNDAAPLVTVPAAEERERESAAAIRSNSHAMDGAQAEPPVSV